MIRGLLRVLIILSAFVMMGMGDLGGLPEGTVPETEVNFNVDLTDRSETRTPLKQFSMEGKTSLEGWHGQGKLSIPFQNINKVVFGELQGNTMMAEIFFRSGDDSLTIKILSRAQFYGSTGYGAFQIRARDIVSIEFQ